MAHKNIHERGPRKMVIGLARDDENGGFRVELADFSRSRDA